MQDNTLPAAPETEHRLSEDDFEFSTKVTPPPPPKPVFIHRCKYGHEQVGDGALGLQRKGEAEPYFMSGPICRQCQYNWLSRKFDTRPTKTVYEAPVIATEFEPLPDEPAAE